MVKQKDASGHSVNVNLSDSFQQFKKQAKEKTERQKQLLEQQELRRQQREQEERARQQMELEKKREREEEELLERARRGHTIPDHSNLSSSSSPASGSMSPAPGSVPSGAPTSFAGTVGSHHSPAHQLSSSGAQMSAAERERLRQQAQERRRREALNQGIDLNRQSDIMNSFEDLL